MFSTHTPFIIAIAILFVLVFITFIHNAILTKQINKANADTDTWKRLYEEEEDALLRLDSEQSVREQVIIRYEERIVALKGLLKEHGIEYEGKEQ